MNDFDRALRHAIKADPVGVLRWLFPNLAKRWRFVRWFDAQSAPRPGEPDRRCDTIAELVDTRGTQAPRALIIELFSDADSDAEDRVLEYMGRYRRELKHGPHGRDRFLFLAALLFLVNGPQRVGWQADLAKEPRANVSTNFQPGLMCVDRQSAVATLEAIADNKLSLGILAFVPAMAGGATLEVIQRWRELVLRVEDGNHLRTLCDIAIVFADKTNSRPLWLRELEGFPLNESTFGRELRAAENLRVKQLWLMEALTTRFAQALPTDLHERIQGEKDSQELDRLFRLALSATDMSAFRAALGA